MTEKRSGTYTLGCGHTVKATLDTQARLRCPKCSKDTIVVRVVR